MIKFEQAIRIIAILGVLVASWAFGMNQIAHMWENGQETLERQALAQCVEFNAPHAVIVDGVAYCYVTYQGNEMIETVENLEKLFNERKAK